MADEHDPKPTENANRRPRREPSSVRTEDINKVLKYSGEPGTSTAGRGRNADVLLGYDPSYREGVPLPRVRVRRPLLRQAASQLQSEQPAPSRVTSQSSSSGYSPSPPHSSTMTRQPLNLSSLLTVSSRGRGSGRVASTGNEPSVPRRNRGGSTHSTSSTRGTDSALDASDVHRDKRPRSEDPTSTASQADTETHHPTSPTTQILPQTWTPPFTRGDHLVHVGDSASSSETTLALAQGLLLPVDLQKESGSPPDRLVATGLVSGIKFIQKMVVLGQKYQEADTE
ncbi:uncharacterized protein LOC131306801 [Rhododendron vialii]|uniref:uncharacterized protein LOC131306801 n=1 Tax=Rhododendron vialii TaxID=182163 RepID=UPI00265DCE72|nr:uncharacterized protein LOC131306801 [Rhododendron vialii]